MWMYSVLCREKKNGMFDHDFHILFELKFTFLSNCYGIHSDKTQTFHVFEFYFASKMEKAFTVIAKWILLKKKIGQWSFIK